MIGGAMSRPTGLGRDGIGNTLVKEGLLALQEVFLVAQRANCGIEFLQSEVISIILCFVCL